MKAAIEICNNIIQKVDKSFFQILHTRAERTIQHCYDDPEPMYQLIVIVPSKFDF